MLHLIRKYIRNINYQVLAITHMGGQEARFPLICTILYICFYSSVAIPVNSVGAQKGYVSIFVLHYSNHVRFQRFLCFTIMMNLKKL